MPPSAALLLACYFPALLMLRIQKMPRWNKQVSNFSTSQQPSCSGQCVLPTSPLCSANGLRGKAAHGMLNSCSKSSLLSGSYSKTWLSQRHSGALKEMDFCNLFSFYSCSQKDHWYVICHSIIAKSESLHHIQIVLYS